MPAINSVVRQVRRRIAGPMCSIALAWCMLRAVACGGTPLLLEAEHFTAPPEAWHAVGHEPAQYHQAAVGLGALDGTSAAQGAATGQAPVPVAGRYRLWIRYLDPGDTLPTAPLLVRLQQGAVDRGEHRFATQHLHDRKPWPGQWMFVWDWLDVELSAETLELTLDKTDAAGRRLVDCFVLSDDLEYEPRANDFNPPLYLQARLLPEHAQPCVVHLFGSRAFAAFGSLPHCNLRATGLRVDECVSGCTATYEPDDLLHGGETSPWVNIGGILDPVGDNWLQAWAMRDYPAPLEEAAFELRLSTTPSDEGLIRSFVRRGRGGGLALTLDLTRLGEMRSDDDWSSQSAAAAAALLRGADAPGQALGAFVASPGRWARDFPLLTGCLTDPAFHAPAIVEREAEILATLGINGLNGSQIPADSPYRARGIRFQQPLAYFLYTARNSCFNDLDEPALQSFVQQIARDYRLAEHAGEVVNYLLADEAGSMGFAHLTSCPTCQQAFHAYLRERGLTPVDLHAATWEDVRLVPPEQKHAHPRLYAHSVAFRAFAFNRTFRRATEALRAELPTARTAETFPEDLSYNGNGLDLGADWFSAYEDGAFTHAWTENWLNWSATYQLLGLRCDHLRSACRPTGGDFGCYIILIGRSPWEVAAMTASAVGRGARGLTYYNYGPFYATHCEPCSHKTDLFPALRLANHAIGQVEDELRAARPARSHVALLWSAAADAWALQEPALSPLGHERKFLHLLLRHAQYPIEIVSEGDVVAGRLADYDAVFLAGANLRRACAAPLCDWVREGGLLYLAAGSGERDEFNEPLDLAAALGVQRQPLVTAQPWDSIDFFMLPGLRTLEDVTLSTGGTAPALCSTQRFAAPLEGEVLASFADGHPALLRQTCGAGQVVCSGFHLAHAWVQPGVAARHQEWLGVGQKGELLPFYSATDYAAAPRELLHAILAPLAWQPLVTTDHPAVEAHLLEGAQTAVVVLANWSGRRIDDLQITLRGSLAAAGSVEPTLQPLRAQERTADEQRLTLPVDALEYLIVRPAE